MSHNKRTIFVSHSTDDVKLIRLISLTFANREISPYFASRKIEGKNPVEKILKAITGSMGLFALITSNVADTVYTRDWVVFEIGCARALGIPIFCWVDKKVETSKSYPRLLENLTDYDTFNSEDDKECCRVAEAIREIAFELLTSQKKELVRVQHQIEREEEKGEEYRSKTDKTSTIPSKVLKLQKNVLLPDATKIADLNIEDNLLNQLYKQAYEQATVTYEDAKLNSFCVQVFPFLETASRVAIYLAFYSKWADRICAFRFNEASENIEHSFPDKLAKNDEDRVVSTTLPWNYSPNWMKFLKKIIVKIGTLRKQSMTVYHLRAFPKTPNKWIWDFQLNDNFTDETHHYGWNGKKVDDSNITKFNY